MHQPAHNEKFGMNGAQFGIGGAYQRMVPIPAYVQMGSLLRQELELSLDLLQL